MSASEYRIHSMCDSIYRNYGIASLTDAEKFKFLVTFSAMLNGASSISHMEGYEEELEPHEMPKHTIEELRMEMEQNSKEVLEGKGRPIDELFESVEQEFPWLCK